MSLVPHPCAPLNPPKRVLFPCGTFAPGLVHDPCQHSVLGVLCCRCAGCSAALWSCEREVLWDSWAWYKVHWWFWRWEDRLQHPAALVLYALLSLVLLTSGAVQAVLTLAFDLLILSAALVLYAGALWVN